VTGKIAFLMGKYCGMNSTHRFEIPSQFRLSEGDKIILSLLERPGAMHNQVIRHSGRLVVSVQHTDPLRVKCMNMPYTMN
jgi:hypothetical protein